MYVTVAEDRTQAPEATAVPMVELTTTRGALDEGAKQRLAAELSTIALELEAAPYRVTVTIPEGAPGVFGPLAERGRERLVKRVTAAVLAAEGSDNTMVEAHRVWVHLRQITNGHWAGFGEVFTLTDAAAYGLKTDKPGSKTDRMRQAAMQSVGADSTA
jgi:phenylpyruvate tautomerase PptA (4-oxalocrotonate tautomerase family)